MAQFVGLRSKLYSFKVNVTEHELEEERKKFEKKQLNFAMTKKSKGVQFNLENKINCFKEIAPKNF